MRQSKEESRFHENGNGSRLQVGVAHFGHTRRDAMIARGVPAAHFHQELFDMR
jgi:hypothetical protein